MTQAITTGVLIVAGWAAVIVFASTVYALVKTIKPNFDERLWRR